MSDTARVVSWVCGILAAGLAALIGIGLAVWLVVSLGRSPNPATTEPNALSNVQDVHYALAEVEPAAVGDATVRIKHWSIRRVPGTVRGEHKESPDEFLIVNVHVSTENPDRVFDFRSWHKPREGNEDGFRAVDNLGNHYERIKFPPGFQVKWQSDRELVSMREPTMDRIVIEKPHRGAKEIRITLPSKNISGEDGPDIRFRIELKRSFQDEHGAHEFDPRDLPATGAEVRREADNAEREKRATDEEVHREAEKAEREKSARGEERRHEAERAHEEELRRRADKEAEELAAHHAEREAQRKRDADAAAVRAEIEEKVKEKEKQRDAERRVSDRLDRDEKDAATLLKLARQFTDTDKPDKAMAVKKLTELIDRYPNTEAAKEARKLRAGL